jgi:nucleotide-binding universal stress UspA family protein
VTATVRRITVSGAAVVPQAKRVLGELAEPSTLLGVLSGVEQPDTLGWRVLQHAVKPVVVVPACGWPRTRVIGRALVPLDGTPESAAAVAETVDLLAGAGIELVALHVYTAATIPKIQNHAVHAERAWEAEFLSRYCAQPGVRLHVRSGATAEHVLDVAAAEDVDLIVLGWSQRLDGDRARTVRRTIHEANVPVMLVPLAS